MRWASRFIVSTKLSTLPDTPSARATEASLPDCTIMPLSRSSTFTLILVSMNMTEAPPLRSSQARLEIGSTWSSASFLSRIAPNTT